MYAFKAKAIRISRAKFHCSCLVFFVLFYLFVCYHFLMNKDVYIDLQLYNISKITPVSFLGHSVLGLNHSQTPEIFRRELSPPSRVCGELYVLLCHWTQASRREIIQMNYRLSVDERQTNGACRLRLAIPLVRLPISLHIHEHLTGWPDSDRFCHPTRINASTATPHCGPSYSNTR